MTRTMTARFDGKALQPEGPVELQADRRYLVTISELPAAPRDGDAWSELEALAGSIEAPEDWAQEHDHYLYGTPKRQS